jgi:hypothetical protein
MPERSIAADRVRFIKLGEGGCWEKECLRGDGIVRLGYDTQNYFDLCNEGRWDEVKALYLAQNPDMRVATGRVNQVRQFCEDDGKTLWVTFHARQMWWAFMDPDVRAALHEDRQGIFRPTREPWSNTDINGELLTMDVLAGSFTKVVGYHQTICKVEDDSYVLRRVNAQQRQEVIDALAATEQMRGVVVRMMQLLNPKDFELLVDLVFTSSGWRRQGRVGGTERTVDMELILPSTRERAFVQVKSATTQREFDDEYREDFVRMREDGVFQRMFFVFHTHTGPVQSDLEGVTLLDAEELATLVMDAGLVSWLIRKVS